MCGVIFGLSGKGTGGGRGRGDLEMYHLIYVLRLRSHGAKRDRVGGWGVEILI